MRHGELSGASRHGGWNLRRIFGVALLLLAEVALVAAVSVVSVTSTQAQFRDDPFPFFGGRRQQNNNRGFNPFAPFFNPNPRDNRSQRRQRDNREAVDYSHAPKAKASDVAPTTKILVLGDSMADWLAYGLEDAFSDASEIGVVRKNKSGSGLIRYESRGDANWASVAKTIIAEEKPQYIVMMLGLQDRRSIRDRVVVRGANQTGTGQNQKKNGEGAAPQSLTPEALKEKKSGADGSTTAELQGRVVETGPFQYRSEKWAAVYIKRIDETIAALKASGVPVFWVGLPSVRGTRSTSDMRYLNDLFRGSAEKAGIVYVDLWDGFVDENGRFTSYGPDFAGQTRRLRTSDGVHFTKAGARKIAHYVEREIRRSMTNRAIPVALPSQDEDLVPQVRPGGPAPRPLAGPVVPLTAATGVATELLGGASARTIKSDPVAVRVLVNGEAIAAPSGRADHYALPERQRPAVAATPAGGNERNGSPVALNNPNSNPRPSALPDSAKAPAPGAAAAPSNAAEPEVKNGVRIIRAPRANPATTPSSNGQSPAPGARIIQVPQSFAEPAAKPGAAASLTPATTPKPVAAEARGQSGGDQGDASRRTVQRRQQSSPPRRSPSPNWNDSILRPPAPIGSGR